MEKDERINVAQITKRAMKNKGMKQNELSWRSGVQMATISNFLNEKAEITTHNLEAIWTVLKVKIAFRK